MNFTIFGGSFKKGLSYLLTVKTLDLLYALSIPSIIESIVILNIKHYWAHLFYFVIEDLRSLNIVYLKNLINLTKEKIIDTITQFIILRCIRFSLVDLSRSILITLCMLNIFSDLAIITISSNFILINNTRLPHDIFNSGILFKLFSHLIWHFKLFNNSLFCFHSFT
jgi:hypothetical protein